MPDLQWQKPKQCNKKLCTAAQPAEVSAKLSSCKALLGKVPDIQDTDKPPEPVATGLHI